MTDVLVPTIDKDTADAEAVVSTWFAADGETVREGQLIAEASVDKASAEVSAPASGVLHIVVAEGDVARQQTVIATIS